MNTVILLVYTIMSSPAPPAIVEMPSMPACERMAETIVAMKKEYVVRWTCIETAR